jgi:hypoxanthine phosphoribosyltransferase
MNEWNKIILTPQEFHNKILKLAAMIPKGKYKHVYGIPRGGLIVAVYLSHYCDLILTTNFLNDFRKDMLAVDDISDTGKTLQELISIYDFKDPYYPNLGNHAVATIHYKPRSIVKPTYFIEQCKNDDWIVYPYEYIEEKPNRQL